MESVKCKWVSWKVERGEERPLGFDIQCGDYRSAGGKKGHSNKDPQEAYKCVSFCEHYTCWGERAVRCWFTDRTTKCNVLSVFKGICLLPLGKNEIQQAGFQSYRSWLSQSYTNPLPAWPVNAITSLSAAQGRKEICKWKAVVNG